ncbi:MAG: FAD-binding protein [Candidatus Bathyarchaeia archaeon]
MVKVLETDVLVIGSGAAGLWSAIKVFDSGIDVMIITKGMLSRSGCSRLSGFHWGPYNPENISLADIDHLGTHIRLFNSKILRSILEYSPVVVRELERLGIYWRRRSDGKIAEHKPDIPYPLAWKAGETGQRVMDILYSETLRRGINFIEDTMATSLLLSNGRCVGATALNYMRGEFFVIKAKATILATGHPGVYRYSTQSRENTGDGIAMAYRCGAEIVNMEFQHWHHSDTQYPESARRLVHNVPSWSECFFGKEFLAKFKGIPEGTEVCTIVDKEGRDVMKELKKLAATVDTFHSPSVQQIIALLYGKRGGLFMRYNQAILKTGVLADSFYNYRPLTNFYHLEKELVPLGTTAHTHAGGVRINERCETTIPGLYAVGGVAGIYPTVLTCLWGGATAAKYAAEIVRKTPSPELDWSQVEAEKERVESFLRLKPSDGFTPLQIQRKIRDLMWDKMWIIKTVSEMKEALVELSRIEKELVPKMGLETTVKSGNFGWAHALEVVNMITVCRLMIWASLTRKETRPPHIVKDYPRQDDENWLKIVVLKYKPDRPDEPEIKIEPLSDPAYLYLSSRGGH